MSFRFVFLLAFAVPYQLAVCQDSTAITFSVYGEVYYLHDFSLPPTHTRPSFVYSHHRTGEVNINLGLLKASYASGKARANLGLMTGTYSNANLIAEPGVLKNIYEVNAGVRLSGSRELWIDAGVFPSHIGFESAIGKENWTLTRSLAADNSPYYEAGVRLSYNSPNKKWFTAFLFLNGWQKIQRAEGNYTPAIGTQFTYKPNDGFLVNASTFIGSDSPDSVRKMRYFHNLYSVIQLSSRLALTAGLDLGVQQKNSGGDALNAWYTPLAILRIKIAGDKFIGLRGEYYHDSSGVIISDSNGNGLSLLGFSSNFDWSLHQHVLWRLETKWMKGNTPAFLQKDGMFALSNWSASTALCFSF